MQKARSHWLIDKFQLDKQVFEKKLSFSELDTGTSTVALYTMLNEDQIENKFF
jgi:hypothetical protein